MEDSVRMFKTLDSIKSIIQEDILSFAAINGTISCDSWMLLRFVMKGIEMVVRIMVR